MTVRRKARTRESQIAFEALTVEGGLLSPDWLSRIAQLAAGMQSEADYRIPKGLNLRDEIGRYWRIAQAHWADFNAGRAAKTDLKSLSERFVALLLREGFGFSSLLEVEPVVLGDRSYPIGRAALAGHVPVVIAPAGGGLDALLTSFGDGGRRRSAFGLAQEYLNAQDGALWGITSDGVTIRIVRDNASLTRPAWIEADLARIFTEERYADFTAVWLLFNETRFGREGQPATDCALETWRNSGREEGIRAREHLRRGVEEALVALGQGFLAHPENQALRASLQNGTLQTRDYFNQLLRLVYRLIFLLTVEERGLLHPDGAADTAKALYAQGYGLRRLCERSVKRNAHDRFSDLWEATKIVFRGVANGEPRLGLPALAGIFASMQCAAVDATKLENRALLLAVFKLAWLREDGSLSRVNWRDMGPEELGSVYESLLELVPQVTQDARQFAFAARGETKGNARKTSGSYYTHDSLVQVLLDNALEPVIADTISKNPAKSVEALLSLSIVDPACGSGHFLLAAARRLAAHVARQQASGTPSAAEYRHALRQVVSHCIYGVDLNSMAVELCKVSLWMEAVEPGLPLTFLNSHIQHGNALLGTNLELMAKGIPYAAWEAVEGDDKGIAAALKKRNKEEAAGQRRLDFSAASLTDHESQRVAQAVAELEATSDTNPESLAKKESQWDRILGSVEYGHQKFMADAWCAAFVWPKQSSELAEAAPTNELWRQLRDKQGHPPALTTNFVNDLARQYKFFHWRLQFPHVFEKGGFDVVLGNPPWDALSPDAKEFFSQWDPTVTSQSPEDQERTVAQLCADPAIGLAWKVHRRELYASVHFMKESGRFELFALGNLGKGDFNAYRMFIEVALRISNANGGMAAQIVPEGLYNGSTAAAIRRYLFESCELKLLLGFQNLERRWFPEVYYRMRFSLYVACHRPAASSFPVAFNVVSDSDLLRVRQGGVLMMPLAMVREFSPETLAVLELSEQRDIDIAAKMYAAQPKFGDELVAGHPIRSYMCEIHMGNDRDLFKEDGGGLPVYEGRMVAAYDHRAKGYRSGRGRKAEWEDLAFSDKAIQPQWLVARDDVPPKVRTRCQNYRIGFCDVASPTNERTLVATLIPPMVLCGHSVPTIILEGGAAASLYANWLAVANSFCMDFLARLKVSLHMSLSILDSLPFPRFARKDPETRFIVPRVARLLCTGAEMNGYWRELADEGIVEKLPDPSKIPGERDDYRRSVLEAELNAFVARSVFGLTREELDFVLDTFPIAAKRDIKAYGEYRTKRVILEIFDAMGEAARTGTLYQTRLDPSPGDPSVAHEPRVSEIPPMPDLIPSILPEDEAGILIWALLHANGGAMLRTDLARAFVLRSQPNLLVRLAPLALSQAAQRWASKVPHRAVAPGLLAAKLRELSSRSGVELTTDASSHSVVKVSPYTGADSNIDPWFRFEARLALHVLRSQPELAVGTIDSSVAGDDRALLVEVS